MVGDEKGRLLWFSSFNIFILDDISKDPHRIYERNKLVHWVDLLPW